MLYNLAYAALAVAVAVVLRSQGYARNLLTLVSPIAALSFGHMAFFVYPAFAFARAGERPAADSMFGAAVLSVFILLVIIVISRPLSSPANPVGSSKMALSEAPISGSQSVAALRMLVVFSVLNLIALVLMYRAAGNWPVLQLLRGGSALDLRDARFLVTRQQSPIVALAPVTFAPIVIATASLVRTSLSTGWRTVRLVAIVIAFVVATFPGNKLPFGILLAVWFLGSQWGPKKMRASSRALIMPIVLVVGISAYALLIFRTLGVQTGGIIETFREDIVGRAVRDPANSSYAAFETYPSKLPHTVFRDINEVAFILGEPWRNLSREAAAALGFSAATNSPPSTIGRFYAQLGIEMVAVGWSAVVIAFVRIENILLTRDRLGGFSGRLWWVMLTIGALKVSIGDAYQVFSSETVIPVAVAVAIFKFFTRGGGESRKALPAEHRVARS